MDAMREAAGLRHNEAMNKAWVNFFKQGYAWGLDPAVSARPLQPKKWLGGQLEAMDHYLVGAIVIASKASEDEIDQWKGEGAEISEVAATIQLRGRSRTNKVPSWERREREPERKWARPDSSC